MTDSDPTTPITIDEPPKVKRRRITPERVAIVLLIAAVIAVGVLWQGKAADASDWQDTAEAAQADVDELEGTVEDLESEISDNARELTIAQRRAATLDEWATDAEDILFQYQDCVDELLVYLGSIFNYEGSDLGTICGRAQGQWYLLEDKP